MSSSEKIVLIGGTGQLGSDIRLAAERAGIPVGILSHDDVDIGTVEPVSRKIREKRPTIVINCAAFHQVERCEEDPSVAFQTNAVGALNVARAAAASGARCVYISTDYVFNGKKQPPIDGHIEPDTGYLESDTP